MVVAPTPSGDAAFGSGATTLVPHGPVPLTPRSAAADQPPSPKPGFSQPSAGVCETFQALSVVKSTVPPEVTTRTRPSRPAGPAEELRATTASVFAPEVNADRRSTCSDFVHESTSRTEEARGVPLSQMSTVSSPVTTNWASVTPPVGTVNVRRK